MTDRDLERLLWERYDGEISAQGLSRLEELLADYKSYSGRPTERYQAR